MAPRWLVVSSQAAMERAEASVTTAQQRAWEAIEQQLFPLQAKRFETSEAAHAALATRAKSWRYPQVETSWVSAHKHYACQGRPTPSRPIKAIAWQRHAEGRPDQGRIASRKQPSACFVIGTNLDVSQWSDPEVIRADKAQAQAAGGFRCRKAPLFFVSSLFVKTPCRMQGLLMVMPVALLVSSVTQRRLRHQLARQHETLP